MRNITKVFLALVMLGACTDVFAVDGESIVLDPTTGNYLITHYSPIDKKFELLVFIPATKFSPTFKSKFKLEEGGIVRYEYTLISGRDSQQAIRFFILDPISNVTSSLPDISLNAPPGKIMADMMNVANNFETPSLWNALMDYSDNQETFRISWGYNLDSGGLTPGAKVGFGFKSRDLPGIIKAEVHSYAPNSQKIDGEELPDAEDGGFGQQYFALLNNDFLRRYAAVPTIAVPTPFDPAVTLERIQTQMHTWIGMQLLDATFSSQLDRYFQSAISAYRLNQPKVGKKHIQTVRELIHKEYPDMGRDEEHESEKNKGKEDDKKSAMIDRLAARVLDFDLKYVTKRMGGDKDD